MTCHIRSDQDTDLCRDMIRNPRPRPSAIVFHNWDLRPDSGVKIRPDQFVAALVRAAIRRGLAVEIRSTASETTRP